MLMISKKNLMRCNSRRKTKENAHYSKKALRVRQSYGERTQPPQRPRNKCATPTKQIKTIPN